MKKSFLVSIVASFLLCYTTFAQSYYVGENVSNLRVDQDSENNAYILYLQDNSINVINPDGSIEKIYESKTLILDFELYSILFRKCLTITEKESESDVRKKLIILSESYEVLEQNEYFIGKLDSFSEKISWAEYGINLFWKNNKELYRTKYTVEDNLFETNSISSISEFDCDEFNSEGFFLSNDKLYYFYFVENSINTILVSESVLSVISKFNSLDGNYRTQYLIRKTDSYNLIQITDDKKFFDTEIISNEDSITNFKLQFMIDSKYLITYEKDEKLYCSLFSKNAIQEGIVLDFDFYHFIPKNYNEFTLFVVDKNKSMKIVDINLNDLVISSEDNNSIFIGRYLDGLISDSDCLDFIFHNENEFIFLILKDNCFSNGELLTIKNIDLNMAKVILAVNKKLIVYKNGKLIILETESKTENQITYEQISFSRQLNEIFYCATMNEKNIEIIKF